ncbi:MAG TPA: hypothetical protein VFT00_03700 [Nocardioides sp.]|nr:hypothetical protein [Nocardioides sp.]
MTSLESALLHQPPVQWRRLGVVRRLNNADSASYDVAVAPTRRRTSVQ